VRQRLRSDSEQAQKRRGGGQSAGRRLGRAREGAETEVPLHSRSE
jgi:hypothetical protein